MFAPPVAKAQAKTRPVSTSTPGHPSTLLAHQPGYGPVDQTPSVQPMIGERSMPRLPAAKQALSLRGNRPHGHSEQATDRRSLSARDSTPGIPWDCSKIPLRPPEQAVGLVPLPPVPGPRLAFPIQRKLKVGAVDDPLEHEADRVAEQVMRAPAPAVPHLSATPHISRKCTECEEKDGNLQKKSAGSAETSFGEAPATVRGVLRSSGQPLDEFPRAYFEPRFGQDFSRVRVHRDATAERSAQDLNAHAYAVGNDIVFGAGQYAPQTDQGKRLIAHELTHVVQQRSESSHNIRREPSRKESFDIRGLPAESKERRDFIFFDLNDATVPDTERDKIDEFAAAKKSAPAIDLYGYASEEGVERENVDLISDRLESVRKALTRTYSGDINLFPRAAAGIRQINYRNFRSVEMTVGESAIKGASSNTQTINCDETQNHAIDDIREGSKSKVADAIDRLNQFHAKPADNPAVQTNLDDNFHSHSPATVSSLLRDLGQIRGDLQGLTGDAHRQCSTPEYGPCLGALALTHRPRITFCPAYFSTDVPTRLETLLHEICHFALFNANDRAYSSERVLPFLSTAEALDNAESIAIFILEVSSPPGTRIDSTLTTPTTDKISDCGGDEPQAKEALAWAQRWNTYALFGVSQTYNDWDTFMFPHIIARLGTINDRYVLAGIFDRFRKLDVEFNGDFTMQCVEGKAAPCVKDAIVGGPDRTLTICPAFFSQSLLDRIVALYAEVTKLVPEIRDDQRRGYAELARDYKIFFWGLPPT
jgi:hypothetical protein